MDGMKVTRAIILLMLAASFTFAGIVRSRAQTNDVRFVLDFLLQGQQSPFVLGRERGYYSAEKINFAAFDPGRGGADAITKVASGTHDVGFGDLSALIEFNAKNPGRELIAVLLLYDQAPLSLISLKKTGIEKPVDLMGRKGGAPSVDATYRLFNVFARVNGIDPGPRAVVKRAAADPRTNAGARRHRFHRGLGDDGGAVAARARDQAR